MRVKIRVKSQKDEYIEDSNNHKFNKRNRDIAVVTLTSLFVVVAIVFIFASCIRNSNAKNNIIKASQTELAQYDLPKFDTVTITTTTRDEEIKVDSVTEMYDKDGSKVYKVTFKILSNDFKFDSIIPANLIHGVNARIVYTGTVKMSYFEEMMEYNNKLVENGNKASVIEDYYKLNGIDFMFSGYTKTTSVEEFEEQMRETYGTMNNKIDVDWRV